MMRDTYRTAGMNVMKTYVKGMEVKVFRDTGCSAVDVRRSLIKLKQLAGKEETCVLIDGTIRHTPLAMMEIDTPFLKYHRNVVCIEKPLYEIIIGNMPGVIEAVDEIKDK